MRLHRSEKMGRRQFPVMALLAIIATLPPNAAQAEPWLRLSQTLYTSAPVRGDVPSTRTDSQGMRNAAGLWQSESGNVAIRLQHEFIEHDFDVDLSENLDVHDLALVVRYQQQFDAGTLQLTVAPGVAVSSNVLRNVDIDRRDLVLDVAMRWQQPVQPGVDWVVGIALDRRFGKGRVYPLFGVHWQPTPQWRVAAVLPEPVVMHQPADRWWWGVRVAPSGNRWRSYDDRRDRHFRLRTSSWQLTGETAFALRPRVWLVASVSREFRREFELLLPAGERRGLDFGATWITSLGFVVGTPPARVYGERW